MSIRATLAGLGLALLLAPAAQAAGKCERLVATGHPDQPPYLWRDPQKPQQLIGASADLLKELGQALGVRIDIRHGGTRKAALDDARSGRADLLATAYWQPERLDQFDFVQPAYLDVAVQAWALRDLAPLFTRLDDLGRHRGLLLGSADYPPELTRRLQALGVRKGNDAAAAIEQLRQGRLDFLVMDGESGRMLAERHGLSGELLPLHPALGGQPLHLALSHNSACNDAWLRGQLAKKLHEFHAAGLPQRLLERNRALWQAGQAAASRE